MQCFILWFYIISNLLFLLYSLFFFIFWSNDMSIETFKTSHSGSYSKTDWKRFEFIFALVQKTLNIAQWRLQNVKQLVTWETEDRNLFNTTVKKYRGKEALNALMVLQLQAFDSRWSWMVYTQSREDFCENANNIISCRRFI